MMCGGRGTRLDAPVEKPLVPVGGRPMVDRVVDALASSRVETVHAVVSPHAPDTRAHLAAPPAPLLIVDAPGEGYVADLGYALDRVERPVLTVAADLPLLAGSALDAVLDAYEGGSGDEGGGGDSVTVCVPAALKEALGASVDVTFVDGGRRVAPTGVNVVADGDTDRTHMTHDARFAVNVNRPMDIDLAEALL